PSYQTNTGAITISVEGTNNYSVSWSNGASGTAINKLVTGYYTVTVTSGACQITKTYLICCCGTPPGMQPPVAPVILCPEQGDLEIVSENVNSPATATSYDGSISLTVLGASSITWYGPNGIIGYGNSISNLGPGEYCAQLLDGCDNAIEKCYELVDCSQSPINISGQVTNTCQGYSVGRIVLNVAGGNPGYTYSWSNGGNASTISNLPSGQYCVTVKDSKGCKANACFNVGLNNTTADGCRILCNGTQVEDYGPAIKIENPQNCTESIFTCERNRTIQSAPFSDNRVEL